MSPSLRIAASAENRAYLKALREAELAAWEAANPRRAVRTTGTRLPVPGKDAREDALYAVLAVLCLATLGHQLWTTFQTAGNWHSFVEFVRVLLS